MQYRPEDFPPIHARDHLRILKKEKWAGILFFIMVVGLTTLYLSSSKPRYAATSTFLLYPPPVSPTLMMSELVIYEGKDIIHEKLFTNTYFDVLKSREFCEKVFDRLDLWDDYDLGGERKGVPFFGETVTITREMITESVSGNVEVRTPVLTSNANVLTIRSGNPEKAARIANTMLEVLLEILLEERETHIQNNLEWLQTAFHQLEEEILGSDQALQDYKRQHDAISLDERENILLTKLHTLNGSLVQSRLARIAAQNIYYDAKQHQADPSNLENAPAIIASNAQIAGLQAQFNLIKTELSRIRKRYKEKHPRMIEIRATIMELEQRILAEIHNAIDSLRISYELTRSQENSLIRELEEVKAEVIRLDEQKIEYLKLFNASLVNHAIFDTVLNRMKENQILLTFANPLKTLQVIDRAVPPDKPSGFRQFFLPVSILVGIILGCFLCYLKDYFDDTIQNEREVHDVLSLPLLAILPYCRNSRVRKTRTLGNALTLYPDIPFVEFFHRFANIVQHALARQDRKTILVVSTSPQEGKTSVTTNLGIALAQRGQKVLLIDGNLRRPSLHDIFLLDNSIGLSNLFQTAGEGSLGTFAQKTNVENLYCLPAGPQPPVPPVFLESSQAAQVLEAFREHFDRIIIDSSAILEVSDATVLARLTDTIIWVMGSGDTSKEKATWTKRSLSLVNADILGVVLNKVHHLRGPTSYYPEER